MAVLSRQIDVGSVVDTTNRQVQVRISDVSLTNLERPVRWKRQNVFSIYGDGGVQKHTLVLI